jgi:hypothetical protein
LKCVAHVADSIRNVSEHSWDFLYLYLITNCPRLQGEWLRPDRPKVENGGGHRVGQNVPDGPAQATCSVHRVEPAPLQQGDGAVLHLDVDASPGQPSRAKFDIEPGHLFRGLFGELVEVNGLVVAGE